MPGPAHHRGPGSPAEGLPVTTELARQIGALAARTSLALQGLADLGFTSKGILDAPAGFIAGLVDGARRPGALFRADEVQAGYPIGALITRREIADSLARDYEYFSTFAATPAASLAVLENERLPERASRVGDYLRDLARQDTRLGDVRGTGLTAGIEVTGPGPARRAPGPLCPGRPDRTRRHRVQGPPAADLANRPSRSVRRYGRGVPGHDLLEANRFGQPCLVTTNGMETAMNTVTSRDGTTIAYDRRGEGPVLILVYGALTVHSSGSGSELAKLLAPHFTVYAFDRRGRGESGDTPPYTVDREIDDIEALIDQAGGLAFLYGHSSGAPLVMGAASRLGPKVSKIALYEAPYNNDPSAQDSWSQYLRQLEQALAQARWGDAVALFMRFVGMPDTVIDAMRRASSWPGLEAVAPTLAYDHAAIVGDLWSVPVELARRVPVPALVMAGDASPPFMSDAARVLSQVIPVNQLRMLKGQTHEVDPAVLAPVLVEFF